MNIFENLFKKKETPQETTYFWPAQPLTDQGKLALSERLKTATQKPKQETTFPAVGKALSTFANTPSFLDKSPTQILGAWLNRNVDQWKNEFISKMLDDWFDEDTIVEAVKQLDSEWHDWSKVKMSQVVKPVRPTFPVTWNESTLWLVGKTVGNIPSSAYNIGAGLVNIGDTALNEWVGDTAWIIWRWMQGAVLRGAEATWDIYAKQWAIWGTTTLINKWSKYVAENPADVLTAFGSAGIARATWRGLTTWGKSLIKGAEYVAPKVVQGVKKITPTLPKAEELLVNQLEKTNRMNPTKYTEFEQMAWERAGKFLADRKITWDAEANVAKLYDNFTKSKVEADKWLDAIQKTYKPLEVPSAYKDMLWELEKRFTYTKDNANLAKVQEYKSKLENGTLSHTDINGTKRLYEQKVKVNYIKDQNSLEVERATNIDNDVRNWQFDEASKLGFDNLKLINKETQLNRYLADNIWDKIARQLGNNNISLTDWIIAWQVPATPQALALLAWKKLAQNVVPKLYQKGLEKIVKIPKKEAPVANIENIGKMETIRKSVTPKYDTNRLLVSPRSSSRSPKWLTPEVILPKWEKWAPTNKTPIIKSDITSRSKIVRPTTKPKESVVVPKKLESKPILKKEAVKAKPLVKSEKVETNITRNEKIEKWFWDSAKSRWDKWEFTSTEKGNAIKYLKSNYKGKEYTIDGKKYKVDAIDNRNEQIRLVDYEWNIKRVKINNLPETKVTDKDIFEYYNQREQKGYKTITKPLPKPLVQVKPNSNDFIKYQNSPKDYSKIFSISDIEWINPAHADIKNSVKVKMKNDNYTIEATKNGKWENIFYVRWYKTRVWVSHKTFKDAVQTIKEKDARFVSLWESIGNSFWIPVNKPKPLSNESKVIKPGIKEQPYWYKALRTEQAVNKIDADIAYERATRWIWAEIINDVSLADIKKLYNKNIKSSDISERIDAVREIKWSIAYANAKHIESKNLSNSENWNNWMKLFNEKANPPNLKK